jgi:hypothetical protein
MHFNDNKYRFQSKRTKHQYDKGYVTIPSPLMNLIQELINVGDYTKYIWSQYEKT